MWKRCLSKRLWAEDYWIFPFLSSYYPGWIMRVYFDLDSDDPIRDELCQLACQDTNLDICDVKNLPGTPMKNASEIFGKNWRWFPTLDPQVRTI